MKPSNRLAQLRMPHALAACACGVAAFLFISCEQDGLEELLPQPSQEELADAGQYWHTRTRSSEEQNHMIRSHAVGFSYDAVNGELCDQYSVRCQVLNLNRLKDANAFYTQQFTQTKETYYSAHSLSEAYSKMCNSSSTTLDLHLYKRESKKIATLFENRKENAMVLSQTRVCQSMIKGIDMEEYEDYTAKHKDSLESYLSPSFIYAISKLREASKKDPSAYRATISRFVDIFGSHVVTKAVVGGRIKLDMNVSTANIKTLESVNEIEMKNIDLYFKESSSSTSEETQTFFEGLLENAYISLSVKGGDAASFNALIANPHDNVLRSSESISKRTRSLEEESSSAEWDNRLELADMEVIPIWQFIPDADIAAMVRTQIEASAPTLQELYGNRNFIDVTLPSSLESVECRLGGEKKTFANPYVVDLFAAGRHVATLCKEWVPEIDPQGAVTVVYPIYENEIQLNAGVCLKDSVAYNVRWLYNRFSVDVLSEGHKPGDMLYLQAGFIDAKAHGEISAYQEAKAAIGYEWPGSIGITGVLQTGKPYYETRKFLGYFFLNTTKTFSDLPGWSVSSDVYDNHYNGYLNGANAFELCGIPECDGWDDLKGRMIRNTDYLYYYNPTELQW